MAIPLKKLIIFDLKGTLTTEDDIIDTELVSLIQELIARTKVVIMSGSGFPEFQKQLLPLLQQDNKNLTNMLLVPASGTRMYAWRGGWNEQYAEHLSPKEKEKIMIALNSALKQAGYAQPAKIYGTCIEDRGSQITFSALGRQAPIQEKIVWDADRSKRTSLISFLQTKLPEFDVRIGGATSIDVTKRGINKAYAIRKLEQRLNLTPEDIIFVGDSLFPGGNDYPAKATGVDCITVTGPADTKKLIREWLSV